MKVFITGTAGFIGFHLARRLLEQGHIVHGYDCMTSYYDVRLKEVRHDMLAAFPDFQATIAPLEEKNLLDNTLSGFTPDVVVHLAAQAGVREGLRRPQSYVDSNLIGTFNLLEAAKAVKPSHLLLASTSSVYGANQEVPFEETHRTDFPVSLYAATKKATEAMSHAYAHLFGIPTTCFRFFTVYGPWGRPDMAYFKFVSAIEKGEPIEVYGGGEMRRDFTYVDDLIEGITRLISVVPEAGKAVAACDSVSPIAPWRTVNIGGGAPVSLPDFIQAIENAVGKEAYKVAQPMQPGDVTQTFASADLLETLTQFRPSIPLEIGIPAFVKWYRDWASDQR